ncbi:hypothetical protein L208DRAFT_1245489 [Tricholoma matsutake]|nr:hypothetical protein L208DRAFT_1245489 [Tricholoma matsutake 945]
MKKHIQQHRCQTLPGAHQIFKQQNTQPWLQSGQCTHPHDEPAEEPERKNYFSPSWFYCVEPICAPCGIVVAWAKFAKSESPTNILAFLESVFPTEDSKPDYICIDKACLVLHTAITNGSWDHIWEKMTWFVVDSYHYINHWTTNYMCRKWCNPAPLDRLAPNLVVVWKDNDGNNYYICAFNTQTCEQLNAWLGGFENILKRMFPGNFDWFLHTMLFYHTRMVIEKQNSKAKNVQQSSDPDIGIDK